MYNTFYAIIQIRNTIRYNVRGRTGQGGEGAPHYIIYINQWKISFFGGEGRGVRTKFVDIILVLNYI